MGSLLLMVLLAVAVFHWTMEPLLQLLPSLTALTPLPWVLLLLGGWLLAGRSAER